MHQTFFSPPHQTIIDAAHNNQLDTIPFLGKPDQVRKYLAPSPATSKGRLKKQRAHVRSTRKKPKTETKDAVQKEIKDVAMKIPVGLPQISQGDKANNINTFCCAALGDVISGTFYTDMTGAFPAVSL